MEKMEETLVVFFSFWSWRLLVIYPRESMRLGRTKKSGELGVTWTTDGQVVWGGVEVVGRRWRLDEKGYCFVLKLESL